MEGGREARARSRPIPSHALSRMGEPCLWMSAGLLAYRLCDRDFDCDACPLDAALRGVSPPAGAPLPLPAVSPLAAPDDRLYGPGHVWIQRGDGRLRLGLDAFAVALAWPIARVVWGVAEGPVAAGATLCELELPGGRLAVATPVAGRLVSRNRALDADVSPLADSPYDKGWLAELEPLADEDAPALDAAALPGLVGAAAAGERSRLDLRRFRRRAAFFLLDGTEATGATLADGGQALTDLRVILGPGRYLELVRDLLC